MKKIETYLPDETLFLLIKFCRKNLTENKADFDYRSMVATNPKRRPIKNRAHQLPFLLNTLRTARENIIESKDNSRVINGFLANIPSHKNWCELANDKQELIKEFLNFLRKNQDLMHELRDTLDEYLHSFTSNDLRFTSFEVWEYEQQKEHILNQIKETARSKKSKDEMTVKIRRDHDSPFLIISTFLALELTDWFKINTLEGGYLIDDSMIATLGGQKYQFKITFSPNNKLKEIIELEPYLFNEYRHETRTVIIGQSEAIIAKKRNTDIARLMKTIATDPSKTWGDEEVYTDWDEGQNSFKYGDYKISKHVDRINKKVEEQTNIKKFLIWNDSKTKINPKYLKSNF